MIGTGTPQFSTERRFQVLQSVTHARCTLLNHHVHVPNSLHEVEIEIRNYSMFPNSANGQLDKLSVVKVEYKFSPHT